MFLRQWQKHLMSILRSEVGFCSGLSQLSCFHRERRKPPGFSDADQIIEINLDYIQVVRDKYREIKPEAMASANLNP
jgi:hypothetical protein